MGEERGYIGSSWGNRREGDHWGDLGVDGWIILGRISRRWDVCIIHNPVALQPYRALADKAAATGQRS